jgi:hypothetical protein
MPCLCKVDQILDYIIIVPAARDRRRRIYRHILGRYWQTECDGRAKRRKLRQRFRLKDVLAPPTMDSQKNTFKLLPMIIAEMKARNMHVVHLTVE